MQNADRSSSARTRALKGRVVTSTHARDIGVPASPYANRGASALVDLAIGQSQVPCCGSTVPPPTAPRILGVSEGEGELTVTFTAPRSLPVLYYTVKTVSVTVPTELVEDVSGLVSPITVTGLVNGNVYKVSVTATSEAGESVNSPEDVSGSPYTTPSAPSLAVESVNGEIIVTVTAPASNGGRPVTYELSDDGVNWLTLTVEEDGTFMISIPAGDKTDILVRAVNLRGPSVASATVPVTSLPGSGLQLFLDGANPGSNGVWPDTSGKTRDCSLNSVTVSTDNSGAYVFNGNGFVQAPSGFADFTGGMTILVFANFGNSGSFERILDFGNGPNSGSIVLSRFGTSTGLALLIRNELTTPIVDLYPNLTNCILNNAWGFYAARLDTIGDRWTLRRIDPSGNGVVDTSGASSYVPANVERTKNYIGRSNWPNDVLFEGRMGILAIYNTALTDAQITAFYDLYKGRYVPNTFPVFITNELLIRLEGSTYSGSGSWLDQTANGNNAVLFNAPTFSNGVFTFNGVNQYASIANKTNLQATITATKTLVIWMKTSTTTQNGNPVVGKHHGSNADYDGYSVAFKSGGNLGIHMNGSSQDNTINKPGWGTTNGVYTADTWIMITAVITFRGNSYNPNKLSKLYINNTVTPSISVVDGNSGLNSTAPITIARRFNGESYGALSVGAFYYYEGELAQTNIATLYDATKGPYVL